MSVKKDAKTNKWYYAGKYRDFTGVRKNYKKRGFATKREAVEAEQIFLATIKGVKGRITVRALTEIYFKEKEKEIRTSTIMRKRSIYRKHILPYFGDAYIDGIKQANVKEWVQAMTDKGLKEGTMRSDLAELKALFNYAYNKGYIARNPCAGVRVLRDPNKVADPEAAEENFWEVDEFKRFLEFVDDPFYKDLFSFLFMTGVRMGELVGLQWKHIDFDAKKINIKQSWSKDVRALTPPKTSNSIRSIDIQKPLLAILKRMYGHAKKYDGFSENFFVFGDHNITTYNAIHKRFQRYLNKSDVKHITLHGLRHSHASHLLSNPMISDLLVANRLGHTVEILYKTYAHIYAKRRSVLTDFLDEF